MALLDRQKEILEYLAEHNGASVSRLSKTVHASEATIRRDLTALEQAGKLRRTFGGAILAQKPNQDEPLMFREHTHLREKNIIADKAVKLISDSDTIFLDASSTVARLVPLLEHFRDLTIVTNSPRHSLTLGSLGIRNYCTGGELLPESAAYVGAEAGEFFARFNADIAFFSCRGVSSDGWLCDSSIEETQLRRDMLPHARKKVFMCDSSKLDHTYRSNLCHISDVDEVISELDILPDIFIKENKK